MTLLSRTLGRQQARFQQKTAASSVLPRLIAQNAAAAAAAARGGIFAATTTTTPRNNNAASYYSYCSMTQPLWDIEKYKPPSFKLEAEPSVIKAGFREKLVKEREAAALGGGPKRIERQHGRGSLTARERLELLFDPNSFHELDQLKAHRCTEFGMAKQHFPGDGTCEFKQNNKILGKQFSTVYWSFIPLVWLNNTTCLFFFRFFFPHLLF